MSSAEVWLRGQLGEAPSALLETMVSALAGDAADVPAELSDAALRLYARVARGEGGREDALPLLAADALLTHAFQAQAELRPEALDSLVRRCQDGLKEIVT